MNDVIDVLQAGGPWFAVLGVVIAGLKAILSGALVPRSTLDVLTTQWEARLEESRQREQDWRTAYLTESMARDRQDGILSKLMTYAETADRVLQGLPGKGG